MASLPAVSDPSSLYRQPINRLLQLGSLLRECGDLAGSARALREYVDHHPGDKHAHHHLALTLDAQRETGAAILAFQRALQIDPCYPEALNNLGTVLSRAGHVDEARNCFTRALSAHPQYEDAEYNLANTESDAGRYQQAISRFEHVLRRNPKHVLAWNNLGKVLLELRQPADALSCFQAAIAHDRKFSPARWNSAIAHLTLGNFSSGWGDFEHRPAKRRHTSIPRWDGSHLAGRHILIHAEQGLGDTIQFIRYCREVRGGRVSLECNPTLIPLFRSISEIDVLAAFDSELSQIDCQIPLMSLPLVFETTADSIPRRIPYLTVTPAMVEQWRTRLAIPEEHLAVGLVWAGNPQHPNDHNRSIRPDILRAFGQPENVAFYCLQQKPQSAGVAAMRPFLFREVLDELTFADTAAVVCNLDLVISVDTAVAHLAGALGRPVWTLLPYAPDWRWMLDRSDTPWYPTMRLFRQPRLNDWPSVLAQVTAELRHPDLRGHLKNMATRAGPE